MRTIRDEDGEGKYHAIEGVLAMRKTPKGVVCRIDGREVLIADSQITDESEVWVPGDEGRLTITNWLAERLAEEGKIEL